MTSNILSKILEQKKQEIKINQQKISQKELEKYCESLSPCRNFINAIQNKLNKNQNAVIAEIKKASPSKGILQENFDPISIAKSYQQAGAACLSILTDEKFFQGSNEYLQQVKAVCDLPILRKDFMIDPYQIYESRAIGADCILLIVAALSQPDMQNLATLAQQLGMAVLVESHNEEELKLALTINTPLMGINNRNLQTFHTDLNTSIALSKHIPHDKIIISESGIHQKSDVELLRTHHIQTFLVGESLMKSQNIQEKFSELFC
ncbi:MAG: indole-3-glycerol phosphate synthase TrpC [Proteobacteria bacterium]|nr:indole-3-glycerol phosphate synthase TrpC [Pseudomonadota bacterium]